MQFQTIAMAAALVLLAATEAFAGQVITPPPVNVPEPASMALLATSVGAFLVYRARRGK